MRTVLNLVYLCLWISISTSATLVYASCTIEDFNRYDGKAYSERKSLYLQDIQAMEAAEPQVRASLAIIMSNNFRYECYQRLADEFGVLGEFQDSAVQQLSVHFENENDEANRYDEWKTFLRDKANWIFKQNTSELDQFVAMKFPMLYHLLAADLETLVALNHSQQIRQQSESLFPSYPHVNKFISDWHPFIQSKIRKYQNAGKRDLELLYWKLHFQVDQVGVQFASPF